MLLRSVFFSLVMLFSTPLFAMPKLDPIPASEQVVVEGSGYALKKNELKKILEDAYNGFPVSDIYVTWSYFPSTINNQYKEIRFTINAHKEYRVACTLSTSSSYNRIIVQNCDSSPGAIVNDIQKNLSDYTAINLTRFGF